MICFDGASISIVMGTRSSSHCFVVIGLSPLNPLTSAVLEADEVASVFFCFALCLCTNIIRTQNVRFIDFIPQFLGCEKVVSFLHCGSVSFA